MSEHFEDFVRKQFPVQAARITPMNIKELAEACGGTLMQDGDKEGHFSRDYIKVRVVLPLNEEQTKARVGDWLVKQGRTFKVYKDPAFRKTFEQKDGAEAPGGTPPRKNNQNRKRKPKGKGPRQPQNGPSNQQKPGNFVPRTPPSPANMPKKRTDVPQSPGIPVDNRRQYGDDQLRNMGLAQSFEPGYKPVYYGELFTGLVPRSEKSYKAFRQEVLAGNIKVTDEASVKMNELDRQFVLPKVEDDIPLPPGGKIIDAEEKPLEVTSPEAAAVQRHEEAKEHSGGKSPEELLLEQKIEEGKVPLAEPEPTSKELFDEAVRTGELHPSGEVSIAEEKVTPITLDELNGIGQDPGIFRQSPGERFRGEA